MSKGGQGMGFFESSKVVIEVGCEWVKWSK